MKTREKVLLQYYTNTTAMWETVTRATKNMGRRGKTDRKLPHIPPLMLRRELLVGRQLLLPGGER